MDPNLMHLPDYDARRRAVLRWLRPAIAVGLVVALAAVAVGVAVARQDDGATTPAAAADPDAPPPDPALAAELADLDAAGYERAQDGEVRYKVTARPGEPATAEAGDVVVVHYTGMLDDGTVFDTSRNARPGKPFAEPFVFQLGGGQVIAGWEVGVSGMRVGESRRLVIPPDLAYGERGAGGVIPPDATLIFDVELIGVAKGQPAAAPAE